MKDLNSSCLTPKRKNNLKILKMHAFVITQIFLYVPFHSDCILNFIVSDWSYFHHVVSRRIMRFVYCIILYLFLIEHSRPVRIAVYTNIRGTICGRQKTARAKGCTHLGTL